MSDEGLSQNGGLSWTRMYVSVAEAASCLGVSRSLIYRLCANGTIEHRRLGERIVVPRRALEFRPARDTRRDRRW